MSEELRDLVRSAGDDAPTHHFDLRATTRRGRALRRRRRLLGSVAGLAAVAVVGGIGVAGFNALAPQHDVAAPPIASTPSPRTPGGQGSEEPGTEVPGHTLAGLESWTEAIVPDLFAPYGTTSLVWGHLQREGNSPRVSPYADSLVSGTVTLTDSDGATGVSVIVARTADASDPDDRRTMHVTNCDELDGGICKVLDDGSILHLTSRAGGYDESDPRYVGEWVNQATLYRTDHVMVSLTAYNGPGDKLGVSRDEPALTRDQLAELVTDPVWVDAPVPS